MSDVSCTSEGLSEGRSDLPLNKRDKGKGTKVKEKGHTRTQMKKRGRKKENHWALEFFATCDIYSCAS